MQIRTIRWPDERQAILDHIQLVHGAEDGALLAKWYGTMPGFDPADCFVIDSDTDETGDGGTTGEIAAHAMLLPRHIQFGKSVLSAAEIGVVGTLEAYRHRGYATALIDRVIERMAERRDAVGVVFGIPNFYERWGYEYSMGLYLTSYESLLDTELALKAGKWNFGHSHQRRTAARLGISGKDITVRPFALSDLPAVMSLYAQGAVEGHSIMVRDEPTWVWQLNYMEDIGRSDPTSFLVAEHDGAILGYLRMVANAPVNWFRADSSLFSIIECEGDDPDATEALLAEAAACARDFAVEQIGLYVHPQSRLMTHALAHGAAMRSFTGAGFLRLNDLPLLLEGMTDTLHGRLEDTVFDKHPIRLRVSTEANSAEIVIGSGDGSEELATLESPAPDLMRLFSGWYGLGNLVEGSYTLRQEKLLSVLFPQSDPRVGIADLI
ncbi:MAG: GNAT family N-acetyltransferase [Chloroflexota bacterium]